MYEKLVAISIVFVAAVGIISVIDMVYQLWFKNTDNKAIPELSDEEIKEKMFGGQYDDQDINDVGNFEAAKWYREQLKQRQ